MCPQLDALHNGTVRPNRQERATSGKCRQPRSSSAATARIASAEWAKPRWVQRKATARSRSPARPQALRGEITPSRGLHSATVSTGGLTETSASEEHTSELQSRLHLVCRLLL